MGVGAIKAGEGFVEFFLKSDKLLAGLSKVEAKLKNFSGKLGAWGASISALSAAVLVPLRGMAETAAQVGDSLKDMSLRTGTSTEALSELGFAAEQTSGDVELIEASLTKMMKLLSGGMAEKHLAKLGLSMARLKGLSPDKQFELIGDAISKLQDPAKRTAMWLTFFGKQGTELASVFERGAEGLREMRQQARDLGLSISQKHADEADEYGDAWKELTRILRSAKMAIGQALIPTFTEWTKALSTSLVPLVQVIKDNREMAVTIFKVAAAVAVVGSALATLGALGMAAVAALAGLKAVISAVVAVFTFLISPIGLTILAVTALAAGFIYLTGIGSALIMALKGIGLALMSGQWALAGAIAMRSLKLVFVSGLGAITDAWVRFKFGILSIMNSLADGVSSIWARMTDKIATEWIAAKQLLGLITEEEAKSQMQAITQMRQQEKNNSAAQRQAALEKELQESLGAYDEEKERIKRDIAILTAQARAGFGKRKNPLADHDYLPKGPINKLQTLSSFSSAGTFSGFAARMLGRAAPGVNERIAAASEETNDLLEKLIDKVGDAGVGL